MLVGAPLKGLNIQSERGEPGIAVVAQDGSISCYELESGYWGGKEHFNG